MHVVVAGGGVGGLCLAQGLVRQGVEVTVLESAPGIARAGYRLHMNADGGHALRDTLTPAAYDGYRWSSRIEPRRELLVFLDSQGDETATRPHLGPENDHELPHTAVNRRTLRQILLAGLDAQVRFGERVTGYTEHVDGVTVELASGETLDADVLVGADGVRSTVRALRLGAPEVVDTGLDSLYARSPLPPEVAVALPEAVFDGFVFAIGPTGRFLTFGPYQPRRPVAEVAAEFLPGAQIDPVEPYLQITLNIPSEGPLSYPGIVATADQSDLHAFWVRAVEGWHPALRAAVENIEVDSIFATRFVGLRPVPAWASSRVTVLGDALHAMPPSFGAGGNTALRDAATLAAKLGAASRNGSDPVAAIAEFEAEMRGYAYPVLEMAIDPKSFAA